MSGGNRARKEPEKSKPERLSTTRINDSSAHDGSWGGFSRGWNQLDQWLRQVDGLRRVP